MEETLTIGKYAVPWALSMILAFIYSQLILTDRVKNLAAVLCGIGLGIVALWVNPKVELWTPLNIIEHILYGFNAGLTAVGFWKTLNVQFRNGAVPPPPKP